MWWVMFRAFIPLLVVLCVLGACDRHWKNDGANRSIESQSKRFVSKHGLELKALRRKENQQGLIERVHVGYFAHQLFDVDEAREAVVDVVEQLLQRLNGDDRSRTQLATYPFTGDQIDLVLKVDHFFGDYFDGTYVGRIVLAQGLVYYYSFDGKLTNRESYSTAREILRDRKMEELRLADSYNSKYKEQWINDMRHSARVEELQEELASEQEVAELKRAERHQQVERQMARIPQIKSQPQDYVLDVAPAPTAELREELQASKPRAEQSAGASETMTHKAKAPTAQVRKRVVPQLVDSPTELRVQGMPSLDETAYRSYEEERDLARPMPQIGEALIDSLILGLIDEEVQAMEGQQEPVQPVTSDVAQQVTEDSDEDLLQLAESLTTQHEEAGDEAESSSTQAELEDVLEELPYATNDSEGEQGDPSLEDKVAAGPSYGPVDERPETLVSEDVVDPEVLEAISSDPFADLDEEEEDFLWLGDILDDEDEELYWSTSQELEIAQAHEEAEEADRSPAAELRSEELAEDLEQPMTGPELRSEKMLSQEEPLADELERRTEELEKSPEQVLNQYKPVADESEQPMMGPEPRPKHMPVQQKTVAEEPKLPPVELELEALLDLHQEYTEDWLDIQLGAEDGSLEEVEILPMDEELPDLEDALLGTGLWDDLPERPDFEMNEVAQEAPKLEPSTRTDEFEPATPSVWKHEASQSRAGSEDAEDVEFTAAPPKAYDSWGGSDELAETYENDAWKVQ